MGDVRPVDVKARLMSRHLSLLALALSCGIYGGINLVANHFGEYQTLTSQALCYFAARMLEERRLPLALSAHQAARYWDQLWLGADRPIIRSHLTNLATVAGLMGDAQQRQAYTEQLSDRNLIQWTNAGTNRLKQRWLRLRQVAAGVFGGQLRSSL